MSTVEVIIDGRRLVASSGATVLSVARDAGIEIPTLCHHDALEPSGACRVCMVEVSH
ncbi:MAG: (2Fe-2S)-binding protein, partial [Deltaproteobacteria bacterium]|nr:(2Fe-2S)-binding protein [Deltaproteobacteria bacterium]